MARLVPDLLPLDVLSDPLRSGEIKTLEAMKNTLGDSWTLFSNIAWFRRRHDGDGFKEGEADIIAVHEDLGVLVLEVKGGSIRRDHNGRWFSRGRNGEFEIKDPWKQARRNERALRELLGDSPDWVPQSVTIGPGVVFPDCSQPSTPLSPDCPSELTIFSEDFSGLSAKMEGMLHTLAVSPRGSGVRGGEVLAQLLEASLAVDDSTPEVVLPAMSSSSKASRNATGTSRHGEATS